MISLLFAEIVYGTKNCIRPKQILLNLRLVINRLTFHHIVCLLEMHSLRKKIRDISFSVVVVFLVAIGVYWLMEQLEKDYLDQYISILGEKLTSMVREGTDKSAVKELFDQFRSDVGNDQVSPEQVEQVAADILNIDNLTDSISILEARAILEPLPPMPVEKREVKDKSRAWRDLEQRLERVYRFEERAKFIPELQFQVDRNLKIILDEKGKDLLAKSEHEHIVLELKELEKEHSLVWIKELDDTLQKRKAEIIKIRHDSIWVEHEKKLKLIQTINFTVDSLNTVLSYRIDSLNTKKPGEMRIDVDVKQ